MKIIGQIIVKQKGYPEDSITLLPNCKVIVKRKSRGSSVTLCDEDADSFLIHQHFMKQFVDSNKIIKEYKSWRK